MRSGYVGYKWLGQDMLDTDGEVRICWIQMVRSGLVGYRWLGQDMLDTDG